MGLVTEPIVAIKRTIKIKPQEEVSLNLILAVGEEKQKVIENVKKYKSNESVKKEFELSKARVEAESRYLRINAKEIVTYQKMLSYLIFDNPTKSARMQKLKLQPNYKQSELWKYAFLVIYR